MKKIYICDTYNHLLISMIKSIESHDDNTLLITNNWGSYSLMNDKLIENIKKSKIFSNVIKFDIFDKKYYPQNIKPTYLRKYIFLRNILKKCQVNFEEYDEIYMFYDITPIGQYLNKKKIYYNLIEDGTDCFKNNKDAIKKKYTLKYILKKYIFHLSIELGDSKYVKQIEVNNKKGVFVKNKKIVEVPKEYLYSKLEEQQKETISKVFLEKFDWKTIDGSTLLITQPLYNDGYVENEKEELEIYQKILDNYCEENENITIKTHPRDDTDFSKLNKNYYIIKEVFPLEILGFYNELRFNKVITISSTAIEMVKSCDNKIYLGWNWLKGIKESERR